MIPSIGRIVHYVLAEGHKNKGGHRAAMISAVYGDAKGALSENSPVDLRATLQPGETAGTAFSGPEGFIDAGPVFRDQSGMKPGTWHEPERVEATPAPAKRTETATVKA